MPDGLFPHNAMPYRPVAAALLAGGHAEGSHHVGSGWSDYGDLEYRPPVPGFVLGAKRDWTAAAPIYRFYVDHAGKGRTDMLPPLRRRAGLRRLRGPPCAAARGWQENGGLGRRDSRGGPMKVTKRDFMTGQLNTLDLDVTPEQIAAWERGALIQDVMPQLTPDEREFLMTGLMPESFDKACDEFERLFGGPDPADED